MADFVFLSEKGKRENNEDAYGNATDELFVVADGLGGHVAGEVAARLAVNAAIKGYQDIKDTKDIEGELEKIFKEANGVVYKEAQKDPKFSGMGTTLVGAVVHLNKLLVANVGDSRCYLFREGVVEQITTDHRVGTHYLTRSIGHLPDVEAEIFERKLKKGDLILICTDGLTDVVKDDVMAKILATTKDLKAKAQGLVEAALQMGSTDNITVGLIII